LALRAVRDHCPPEGSFFSVPGIITKTFKLNWFNVALFDVAAADVINCGLNRIEDVSVTFSEQDNPYFINKYYPTQATTASPPCSGCRGRPIRDGLAPYRAFVKPHSDFDAARPISARQSGLSRAVFVVGKPAAGAVRAAAQHRRTAVISHFGARPQRDLLGELAALGLG
jgi:hypothetical protein